MLYFLKHKSDTFLTTTKYLADIAPFGHVKCLQTNNRIEFTSEPFQQLLVLNKIKQAVSSLFSISKWDCWVVMANFIFYGKVSPYWVKVAKKLMGLHIDGFSVY